MAGSQDFYIANLDFILNYGDGTTNDEIEYELFRLAFQMKYGVHYDRKCGGSFPNIEQERSSDQDVIMLQFAANMIESVYLTNEKKKFDPFILVGYSDIVGELDKSATTFYVTIYYRLLKDINKVGQIAIGV